MHEKAWEYISFQDSLTNHNTNEDKQALATDKK